MELEKNILELEVQRDEALADLKEAKESLAKSDQLLLRIHDVLDKAWSDSECIHACGWSASQIEDYLTIVRGINNIWSISTE